MTEPGADETLSARLKRRTWDLHTRAERSGVIADLLRGQGSVRDYALLLRNLAPVYRAIEAGLEAHGDSPLLAGLARPEVYRSAALAQDLASLAGASWARDPPLLPSGLAYADLVRTGGPAELIAHAYVRYLGDLNGGQTLMRLLAKSLGLGPASLNLYAFPAIADLPAFIADYRRAIDRAGERISDWTPIETAARAAFSASIALSEEIRRSPDAREGSGGDGRAA